MNVMSDFIVLINLLYDLSSVFKMAMKLFLLQSELLLITLVDIHKQILGSLE